jgi:hypothetical protein
MRATGHSAHHLAGQYGRARPSLVHFDEAQVVRDKSIQLGLIEALPYQGINYGFLPSYAETLPAFEQFPIPFLSLSALVQ